MPSYNGWRSWNAWNVYTWIGNTEALYYLAKECLDTHKSLNGATRAFIAQVGMRRTPDGARFNPTCVREALQAIREE